MVTAVITIVLVAVAVGGYLHWGIGPVTIAYRLGFKLGRWQMTRRKGGGS